MNRRSFFKGLLGVTLAGLFSAIYGFIREPAFRLRVPRWKITPASWTAGPLRIVAIGDIHMGEPYVGIDRLARIVARAHWRGSPMMRR